MNNEDREQLTQIRERQDRRRLQVQPDVVRPRLSSMFSDIELLLSLIDSRASSIPYCVNCWHAVLHNGPAGAVDDACTHEGCNCGYYTPATSTDAATQMRNKCVERVKERAEKLLKEATEVKDNDYEYARELECAGDQLNKAATELQSLSLDNAEEKK